MKYDNLFYNTKNCSMENKEERGVKQKERKHREKCTPWLVDGREYF